MTGKRFPSMDTLSKGVESKQVENVLMNGRLNI